MTISEMAPPRKGRSISLTVVRPEMRKPAANLKGDDYESAAVAATAPRNNFYTIRIPAVPTIYRFSKQSSMSGLKFLAVAIVFFSTAAFLLFEMSKTPLLRTPITTVSVICVVIGLTLAHLGIRNLLGRIRVDAGGIRLSPAYLGYFIPWAELRGWNYDGFSFHFRAQRTKHDLTLDSIYLTAEDRNALHELLVECATEKECDGPMKKSR